MSRYHGYLTNGSERVRMDHADMKSKTVVKLAVKACNDPKNFGGLAPTVLKFGVVLRSPYIQMTQSQKRERMSAIFLARKCMI